MLALCVETIVYRHRCGIPWRDLAEVYGPWQTVWTWHRCMAAEGVWDPVVATLTAGLDVEGLVDWPVSMDSRVARSREPSEVMNPRWLARRVRQVASPPY